MCVNNFSEFPSDMKDIHISFTTSEIQLFQNKHIHTWTETLSHVLMFIENLCVLGTVCVILISLYKRHTFDICEQETNILFSFHVVGVEKGD